MNSIVINDLNNINLYQKKFIYYKYLLDKTYRKIKKLLLKLDNENDDKIMKEYLKDLKCLTTKLELLLLLTNNYYLIAKI